MGEVALYSFYETALFAAGLALILRLCPTAEVSGSQRPIFWTAVLASKLFLGCLFPMILTFAGVNGTVAYSILAVVAFGAMLAVLKDHLGESSQTLLAWRAAWGLNSGLLGVLFAVLLLVPAVVSNIGPITEIDSVVRMGDLLRWTNNEGNPYDKFSGGLHYVSFWEMGFLPSLVLTSSDHFLWWPSLQAVILLVLAGYSLARHLGLAPALAGMLALNGAALPLFWSGPSGVMTLKNDMIYNAGILCFILGLVCFAGAKSETATIFLVSLGAAFACTKFSGPFLVSSVFVALAVTSRRAASQWRRWLTIAALMAAAVLISSGHYYVKNILLYGNPFSPLGIRLFGWVLIPGIDFSGTSILSSLGDPELWRILLGLPSVSYLQSVRFPAGVLFPPMLITVLTVGVVCAARSMYKIFVARAPLSGTKLLTLPILIGWVLYAASIWSAHDHAAGEWFYLRDLMSLRYATATVLLSEMWIVLGLLRWRPGALLGPILLWISLLSRLYVLYFLFRPGVIRFAQGKADLVLLATVAVAAVLLVTMALRAARRPALRGAVLYTSFLGLMLCTPTVFEGHRAFWLPQWEPVNEALFNIPPSTVFLIGDSPYASSPYTVNGRGFRHHVTMGKEKDLWNLNYALRGAPEEG